MKRLSIPERALRKAGKMQEIEKTKEYNKNQRDYIQHKQNKGKKERTERRQTPQNNQT